MPRDFNGTSDYVAASSAGGSADMTYGSMAGWVKYTSNGAAQRVMSLHASPNNRVALGCNSTGTIFIRFNNSNTSSTTAMTSGQWYFICGTKDTGSVAGTLHIYDPLTNTWTSESGGSVANSSTGGAGFFFGSDGAGTGSFWAGEVGHLAVWKNIVLTTAQVQNLAFNIQAWYDLNPTSMWNFDQQAVGQLVSDISGGGAGETSRSGTSVSSDSLPVFTYGFRTRTVNFSVATQYLQSVAGTVGALTGTITKQTNKSLAGTIGALTGLVTKQTNKALTGAVGALTGILTTTRVYLKELAGTVGALTGELAKQTNKALTGTGGALTGALSKLTSLNGLAGTCGALTGDIAKSAQKALAGTMGAVSGILTKQTNKALSGASGALTGALATGRLYTKALAGTMGALTGSLSTSIGSSIRFAMKAGTVARTGMRGGRATLSKMKSGIISVTRMRGGKVSDGRD